LKSKRSETGFTELTRFITPFCWFEILKILYILSTPGFSGKAA
jgi:hypothetical protein